MSVSKKIILIMIYSFQNIEELYVINMLICDLYYLIEIPMLVEKLSVVFSCFIYYKIDILYLFKNILFIRNINWI